MLDRRLTLQSQNFNPEIVRGDIEAMSDEMFDIFLKGVEQAHKDKIEAERLAEVERLAEIERKAEADRLAEIERLATIEAERIAKEQTEKEAEIERLKQAENLEAERKENERLRAELEAKEAEKLEAERLAKIEAKKAAKAPVKEKLNLWVDGFSIGSPVGLKHETATEIQNKFEAFKQWAKKEIEKV